MWLQVYRNYSNQDILTKISMLQVCLSGDELECKYISTHMNIYIYYPNLVIQPVDNNEHQRIDDVSTDRIIRYTVSRDNEFRFVTHELFDCCVQASQ